MQLSMAKLPSVIEYRASAQRTQLGLKTVDLPRGVVRLKTGEARAFLKVEGYTAHQRSPDRSRLR